MPTWPEKEVTHSLVLGHLDLPYDEPNFTDIGMAKFKRRQLLFKYSNSSSQKILYVISS
jgi:hypothetical protein